ncbi:hypothetical protein ACFUTV_09995 [Streptomyces sp. NPDC057298]|uniref:hypothetical protein n=1 Tax=Streptomyces sp. NPDC057298 TaxID=3346091 RepID=UPI0036292EB8
MSNFGGGIVANSSVYGTGGSFSVSVHVNPNIASGTACGTDVDCAMPGPGETMDNVLASRAYGSLAKLLAALRAHDTRIVEQLAEQQAQSRGRGVQSRSGEGAESDPKTTGCRRQTGNC